MARVLIAWELGDAFGHVAPCLRIAEALRQRGHAVVLALKDVRVPLGLSALQGVPVLQAPLTPPHRPAERSPPVNYADVLLRCGFTDAQHLSARLRTWRRMLTLANADVLVGDHAPTALLAAHLSGIPHVAIGNGFAIPPSLSPWPSIRPWDVISEDALIAAENRLDHVTETAQKALGRAAPVRMRTLFGVSDLLLTFAALDQYGERPNGCYVGPILSASEHRRVDWQGHGGAKVLAYLRPEIPGCAMLMQALVRCDAEVLCIAPGMSPEMARRFATRRMRVSLAPVDLGTLLKGAHLAVGYGSSGFSTQALLAGVPLLMRPPYAEQALFARCVEALGAGKLLDGRIAVDTVAPTLHTLLSGSGYREGAQAFQRRHHDFSPEQAIERVRLFIEGALVEGN